MGPIGHVRHLQVVSVGSVAKDFLDGARHAWLDAAFERSLYLSDGSNFLCLGGPDVGRGPLNALLASSPPRGWTSKFVPSALVGLRAGQISFGDTVVDWRGATLWKPPAPPLDPDPAEVAAILARLPALRSGPHSGAGLWPEEGLSRAVIARDFREAIAVAARSPLHSFSSAIRGALSGMDLAAANDAAQLIGLGPGLTPSGDDVIGGALVALHALCLDAAARRLWSALLPLARTRTSPLTLAHLKAAAAGEGHQLLHAAINRLLSGSERELAIAVSDLGRVGHTSGFDAFAGAILAIESWIAQRAP